MNLITTFVCVSMALSASVTPNNDVYLGGTNLRAAGDWLPGIGEGANFFVVKHPMVTTACGDGDCWIPSADPVLINTFETSSNGWHTYLYRYPSTQPVADVLPGVDLTNAYVGDFDGDGVSDLLAVYRDANGYDQHALYLANTDISGNITGYRPAGSWPGPISAGQRANYYAIDRGPGQSCDFEGSCIGVPQSNSLLVNVQDSANNWHSWIYAYPSTAPRAVTPSIDLTNAYVGHFVAGGANVTYHVYNYPGASDLLVAWFEPSPTSSIGTWHNDVYVPNVDWYGNITGFTHSGDWALPGTQDAHYSVIKHAGWQDWDGTWVLGVHSLVINDYASGAWQGYEYSYPSTQGTDVLPGFSLGRAYPGDFNGDGEGDILMHVPLPITGAVYPQYQVLAVFYAPPGNAHSSTSNSSSMNYSQSTTFGTNVSTSDSFTESMIITGGVGFANDSASFSYGNSYGNTDESATDVKQTLTDVLPIYSSCGAGTAYCFEGVNHEADSIRVLLNPKVSLTIPYPYTQIEAELGAADSQYPLVKDISVYQLKNPSVIPQDLWDALSAASICGCAPGQSPPPPCVTVNYQAAFADLLSYDPLADPNQDLAIAGLPYQYPVSLWGTYVGTVQGQAVNVPLSSRYVPLSFVDPVTLATTNGGAQSYDNLGVGQLPETPLPSNTWKETVTYAMGHSFSEEHTQTIKESVGGSIGVVKVSGSGELKFTWKHSNTTKVTSATGTQKTLYLARPSWEYNGPTVLNFYLDTLFNTLMFNLDFGDMFTDRALPAAPVGASAAAQSSASVSLTWTPPRGGKASGYVVQRASDAYALDPNAYAAGGAPGTWATLGSVATGAYTDVGLQPNTRYWYRVAALNQWGTSEYTSAVSAMTSP